MPAVERVQHALRLRLLEVASVEDLTPRLRRVVLRGDLDGFTSSSPDDHVKLIFPRPGEDAVVLPELGARGIARDPGTPPTRDYTPRAFDVAAGTLTIDMVVHGGGPALTWAASATPGAQLALPVGDGFAWAGCEAGAARRIRAHLREDRGLPKAYTKVTGYWRRGAADHHDPPEAEE